MAFEPEKIDYSQINNGEEYGEGSLVSPTDLNNWFKSGAYSQKAVETFTENVDISELNNSGEPFVGIIYKNINGRLFPYLKLANLKGERGDSGLSYGASLSNEIGESDTDGYTKSATNSIICNPNLLINGDFRVNQRGKTTYQGYNKYTVDRWISRSTNSTVSVTDNGLSIKAETGTSRVGLIQQPIENPQKFSGKTVTLSTKIIGISGTVNLRVIVNGTYTEFADISAVGTYYFTITLPNSITSFVVGMRAVPSSSVQMEYIKLEGGSIATPNYPKPYAEELVTCQRYYQKARVDACGFYADNSIEFSIPVSSLRDVYTLNVVSYPNIVKNDGTGNKATSIAYSSLNNGYIVGGFNVSGFQNYNLYYITGGIIEIDAEIY